MNIKRFLNPQPTIDYQALPQSEERRYEFKIAAEWGSSALGRSWLRMHPEGFRDAYPARLVNNLYLDTNELKSFQENRWGIGDRAKIRLRWYGLPENNVVIDPFLEIKIKSGLVGDKARQQLSCKIDLNQPYQEIIKIIRAQADAQWQTRLHAYTQPTIINRYRREYYISPDGAIRATLDSDLTSYNQRFSALPNLLRSMSHDNGLLIEVKAKPEHVGRLQDVMSFFPIQRSRNSKYVNGVSGGPF